MNRPTAFAAAIAIAAAATAQDLNKEITIERQINPTLRSASRLSASPMLVQPEITIDPLKFSNLLLTAETGASIDTLPAADPSAAIVMTPWRGYASIGYFPAYNLGANLGYRIIDKDLTSLGVWAQFDGAAYKSSFTGDPDEKERYSRNTVTAGADFTSIIRRAGRLDISADFTYDNLRDPWSSENNPVRYGATLLNTDIHWSARNVTMAYYVTADYHNFAFHKSGLTLPSQHDFNIQGGTAYFFSETTQLAGSVGFDFINTSNYVTPTADGNVARVDGKTLGLINFTPAFRYKNDLLKLNLGFRLQFMSHMEKSVNIAPDIHLYVTPLSCLTLFATVTGGKQFNPLAKLWEWNPYINPTIAYGASNIPLDATVGVSVGPFSGFSATIKGGYAMANEWLMPDCDNYANIPFYPVVFTPVNLRAFHAELSMNYKLSDLFGAHLSYAVAPGSKGHAYYLDRDRAKGVFRVSAESSPIDRLTVHAAFSLRHGRAFYDSANRIDLKADNSLDAGALYRLTDAVSVFADFENILNCKAPDAPYVSGQGIHGAVGAAIKF